MMKSLRIASVAGLIAILLGAAPHSVPSRLNEVSVEMANLCGSPVKTVHVWSKPPGLDLDRDLPIPPYESFLHAALTISDAMAVAKKGDTVLVRSFLPYEETVLMVDGVTLVSEGFLSLPPSYTSADVLARCFRGEPGPAPPSGSFPVITSGGSGSVVIFSSLKKRTFIRGFTITGGDASMGGGVLAVDSKHVQVEACCLVFNTATVQGGGLSAEGCHTVVLDRNVVIGNTVLAGDGGGLAIDDVKKYEATADFIAFNDALAGGGGGEFITNINFGMIQDRTVSGNKSDERGAAFKILPSQEITIRRTTYQNNESRKLGGGAGLIRRCKRAIFTDCDFSDNKTATDRPGDDFGDLEIAFDTPSGGAIQIVDSNVLIERGSFVDNKSKLDGGGINIVGADGFVLLANVAANLNKGNVIIRGVSFKNNQAQDDGGAINCTTRSFLTVEESGDIKTEFVGNIARGSQAGALRSRCRSIVEVSDAAFKENRCAERGGACVAGNATLTIRRCEFEENGVGSVPDEDPSKPDVVSADGGNGGAIAVISKEIPFFQGGPICNASANLVVTGATFKKNEAVENAGKGGRGGAVFIGRVKGFKSIRFALSPFFKKSEAIPLTFTNNEGLTGTAIFIILGDQPVAFAKNEIKDAVFDNDGVQVHALDLLDPVKGFYSIFNCKWTVREDGTGLSLQGHSPKIDGPKFKGNELGSLFKFTGAGTKGTGIFLEESEATIRRIRFEKCAIGVSAEDSSPHIDECQFDGNRVGVSYLRTDGFIKKKSMFKNHTVAAIELKDNSSPTIEKNVFESNQEHITTSGGSDPDLIKNTFD